MNCILWDKRDWKRQWKRRSHNMNGYQYTLTFPTICPSSELFHIQMTSILADHLQLRAEKHWSPEWKHLTHDWKRTKLVPNPNFIQLLTLTKEITKYIYPLLTHPNSREWYDSIKISLPSRKEEKWNTFRESKQGQLWTQYINFIMQYCEQRNKIEPSYSDLFSSHWSTTPSLISLSNTYEEKSHIKSWSWFPLLSLLTAWDEIHAYMTTSLFLSYLYENK